MKEERDALERKGDALVLEISSCKMAEDSTTESLKRRLEDLEEKESRANAEIKSLRGQLSEAKILSKRLSDEAKIFEREMEENQVR